MCEVVASVRELCANHLSRGPRGIQGYCLLEWTEGHRCVFATETDSLPRCRYFEEAVLPDDPRLEALYHAERRAAAVGYELTKQQRNLVMEEAAARGKPRVNCSRCGEMFLANSNRQKMCEGCRKEVRREQSRERVKKARLARCM